MHGARFDESQVPAAAGSADCGLHAHTGRIGQRSNTTRSLAAVELRRAPAPPRDWISMASANASSHALNVHESMLAVDGMHCAACAPAIEAALRRVPGVLDAEVNGATHRARVRWTEGGHTPVAELVRAIQALGYRARPARAEAAGDDTRREQRLALWHLFVAGFCMMQVMMYATPAYVAAPGEITPDIDALLRWASWLLTVPVVLFCARP